MRFDVVAEFRRHERCELDKPRIDLPSRVRKAGGPAGLPAQTLLGDNRSPVARGRLDFSSAKPKHILGADCLCSGEARSKRGGGRWLLNMACPEETVPNWKLWNKLHAVPPRWCTTFRTGLQDIEPFARILGFTGT